MAFGSGSGTVRIALRGSVVGVVAAVMTPCLAKPVLLFGPGLQSPDTITAPAAIPQGSRLPLDVRLSVRDGSAFVLVAPGQIIQLGSGTVTEWGTTGAEVRILEGTVTLHTAAPHDSMMVWLVTKTGTIRTTSAGVRVVVNGHIRHLQRGDVLRAETPVASGGAWVESHYRDARYLLDLVARGVLPSPSYPVQLPSTRPGLVRQSFQGYGGVATYEGTRYYVAEITYRLRVWHLRLAYDLWFAFDRDGSFYSEAWDQWKDLVDHVNHVQLFMPGDPVFLRLGHIDRLTYGKGQLMENYTNAVFLPFERRTGFLSDLRTPRIRLQAMVNDVGEPRVFGGSATWQSTPSLMLGLSMMSDLDQFSNVPDDDGDSYPDAVDPEPDVANTPQDSIILAHNPVSLDSIPAEPLHAAAVTVEYIAQQSPRAEVRLGGEVAVLSSIGTGFSVPSLLIRYRSLAVGLGLDFQSPRFSTGIFDRTYELDKARFVIQPDSSLRLVSLREELTDTRGWLYGWNNSLALQAGEDFTVRTRFRDVTREDYRNKLFSLSVDASFPFLWPVSRFGAFIEQKNVSRLFRERTDGEIWGGEIRVVPHQSAVVRIRYRERYSDDNRDSSIGDSEVDRSFSASMTVDGGYWWDRFRAWRATRTAARDDATQQDATAP